MKHSITIHDPDGPMSPYIKAGSPRVTVGRVQRVAQPNGVKVRLEQLVWRYKIDAHNPGTLPLEITVPLSVDAYLDFGNLVEGRMQCNTQDEPWRNLMLTIPPGSRLIVDQELPIAEPWKMHAAEWQIEAGTFHNYPELRALLTGHGPVRMNSYVHLPFPVVPYNLEIGCHAVWSVEVI